MMCDNCGKKPATVHWTEMVNNVVKKMHLCEDCAAEKGLDVNNPAAFTDVLLGLGAQKEAPAVERDVACPVCHMRISDFKKTSRLGCQACYDVFVDELTPLLEAMHKGNQHVGKTPVHHKPAASAQPGPAPSASPAALRRRLEAAIADERYEDAARLRDQIRELEEQGKPCARKRPAAES